MPFGLDMKSFIAGLLAYFAYRWAMGMFAMRAGAAG